MRVREGLAGSGAKRAPQDVIPLFRHRGDGGVAVKRESMRLQPIGRAAEQFIGERGDPCGATLAKRLAGVATPASARDDGHHRGIRVGNGRR